MENSNIGLKAIVERITTVVDSVKKIGVSPIEVDILLQELRELYVALLQYSVRPNEEEPVVEFEMSPIIEPKAAEEVHDVAQVCEPEVVVEMPTPIVEMKVEEPTPEEETKFETPAPIVEAKASAPIVETKASAPIVETKVEEVVSATMVAEPVVAFVPAAAPKEAEIHREPTAVEATIGTPAQEVVEEVSRPKPTFAPEPEPEPVAPVAPLMQEVENDNYDELFTDNIESLEEAATVVQEEPKVEQPIPHVAAPKKEHTSEPKAVSDPASKQPSLFDYLRSAEKSNEQPTTRTIGDTFNRSISDVDKKVNTKKVTDLRPIININDKFSFLSELFQNNMKAYNDFILRLNAIQDRDEALAHVHQIAQQYKWDENSLVVKTFYKIFDRKF